MFLLISRHYHKPHNHCCSKVTRASKTLHIPTVFNSEFSSLRIGGTFETSRIGEKSLVQQVKHVTVSSVLVPVRYGESAYL